MRVYVFRLVHNKRNYPIFAYNTTTHRLTARGLRYEFNHHTKKAIYYNKECIRQGSVIFQTSPLFALYVYCPGDPAHIRGALPSLGYSAFCLFIQVTIPIFL